MTLKLRAVTAFIAFLFMSLSFASSTPICPKIDLIKQEGVSAYEGLGGDQYIAYQVSPYQSDTTWVFSVFVDTTDETNVLSLANEELAYITEEGAPVELEDGVTGCLYIVDNKPFNFAIAIQMPDFIKGPMKTALRYSKSLQKSYN